MQTSFSPLTVAFVLSLSTTLLAQTASAPELVVPSFADLKITTRSLLDGERPTSVTNVLYLKGARERRESVIDGQTTQSSTWAFVTECDRRRTIHL